MDKPFGLEKIYLFPSPFPKTFFESQSWMKQADKSDTETPEWEGAGHQSFLRVLREGLPLLAQVIMMTNVVEISWDQVISKMLYALEKMRITFLKWIKQQISFFQIGCFCLYDQAVIAWFTFFLNEMFLSTWSKLIAVGLFGLSQDERACLSQQAKISLLI